MLVVRRGMVHLRGNNHLLSTRSFRQKAAPSVGGGTTTTTSVYNHPISERTHSLIGDDPERPPDPRSIAPTQVQQAVDRLADWWRDKRQVLCLTGAGISTESGIPDYRGNMGSYHTGHKPMVHDQFIRSEANRQRYWGRGLVGWRFFDEKQPAAGHHALAALERTGRLGVHVPDRPDFYDNPSEFRSQQQPRRRLSVVTQNVDSLHRRAGTRHLVELHGRTDRLQCMHCGSTRDRRSFHEELEALNREWLAAALAATKDNNVMRADGDAEVAQNFHQVRIPDCQHCDTGFLKPSVVFFGDSVPAHRVRLCQAAVQECDGLLVVGSSLAVHSAFRHVRAADQLGKDIAILNVGNTRAEVEGLNVLKLEAPAGPVLEGVVARFTSSGDEHLLSDEPEEEVASNR